MLTYKKKNVVEICKCLCVSREHTLFTDDEVRPMIIKTRQRQQQKNELKKRIDEKEHLKKFKPEKKITLN